MNARAQLRPPLLIDPIVLIATIALVTFGLVMLYSTTAIMAHERYGDELFFVRRQVAAAAVGLLCLVLASRVDLQRLRRYSPIFYLAALGLLLLTYIPGLGDAAGGARRWVNIGIGRFQPGEFVKLCLVIFLAGFIDRHESKLNQFLAGLLKPLALIGVPSALFLIQPDFGSTVVVMLVSLSMLAVSGVRLRQLLLCGAAVAAIACALVITSPYRMSRVSSFMAPWEDASGKGYQLLQSLIAVGTGQLSGVGLGESQQKLFFLPAAHTDFIFAVIGEELGLIGCLAVISIFLVILWRGVALAARLPANPFYFSLAVGLTMLIVLPALLNVGVVIGLLPTKGMVLPLVGYGGSSLVVNLAAVGILLALTRAERTNQTG